MKGCGAIVLAVTMLGGCSQEAPPEASVPHSYYIRKVDLYRDPPDDICRAKNGAFLSNLIGRVSGALPSGTSWVDLEDFNARGGFDGKGMEAVLRFRAVIDGGAPILMSLAGKFDPATCLIGSMAGGVGADPHDPHAVVTLRVPAD